MGQQENFNIDMIPNTMLNKYRDII